MFTSWWFAVLYPRSAAHYPKELSKSIGKIDQEFFIVSNSEFRIMTKAPAIPRSVDHLPCRSEVCCSVPVMHMAWFLQALHTEVHCCLLVEPLDQPVYHLSWNQTFYPVSRCKSTVSLACCCWTMVEPTKIAGKTSRPKIRGTPKIPYSFAPKIDLDDFRRDPITHPQKTSETGDFFSLVRSSTSQLKTQLYRWTIKNISKSWNTNICKRYAFQNPSKYSEGSFKTLKIPPRRDPALTWAEPPDKQGSLTIPFQADHLSTAEANQTSVMIHDESGRK